VSQLPVTYVTEHSPEDRFCNPAPAQEAIKYEAKVFYKAFETELSPYQGWPDDEKDRMWEDMYGSKACNHWCKEELPSLLVAYAVQIHGKEALEHLKWTYCNLPTDNKLTYPCMDGQTRSKLMLTPLMIATY
jgi:hypothetical protein